MTSTSSPAPVSSSFADALECVRDVDGWLSDGQAQRLWECAGRVTPPGVIVEIGSYRGRSTTILALAAAPGVTVIAIDPHAGNDRGPQQWHGSAEAAEADHRAFHENLERAGVADRVRHVRRPSQSAFADVETEVALLYVDGAHGYRPADADIARWSPRVNAGGTLLIHDAFSAIGVTLALLRRLFLSGSFRYVGRVRSLVEYRQEPVRGRARLHNALRQGRELGWFARNVAIKIAITTGRTRAARRLSGGAAEWPY
jgi:predicted O-methyltransferase YrrM